MACVHLRRIYELCQSGTLRLSTSDLIHLVCRHCGILDLCPSITVEQRQPESETAVEAYSTLAEQKTTLSAHR